MSPFWRENCSSDLMRYSIRIGFYIWESEQYRISWKSLKFRKFLGRRVHRLQKIHILFIICSISPLPCRCLKVMVKLTSLAGLWHWHEGYAQLIGLSDLPPRIFLRSTNWRKWIENSEWWKTKNSAKWKSCTVAIASARFSAIDKESGKDLNGLQGVFHLMYDSTCSSTQEGSNPPRINHLTDHLMKCCYCILTWYTR